MWAMCPSFFHVSNMLSMSSILLRNALHRISRWRGPLVTNEHGGRARDRSVRKADAVCRSGQGQCSGHSFCNFQSLTGSTVKSTVCREWSAFYEHRNAAMSTQTRFRCGAPRSAGRVRTERDDGAVLVTAEVLLHVSEKPPRRRTGVLWVSTIAFPRSRS